MSETTVTKKEYKGWKNCIEISNGIVDLIATTDVGPRIIRYGFKDKENEFCEVAEHIGTTGGSEWKMYGGHRLWHSPEAERTYERDNAPVEWKKKKNGIKLIQQTEPHTFIKKEIEITLSPDSTQVTVLNRLTNMGVWEVELAAWAITVMAPGGKEIVPQVTKETGYLPNRMLSLWPYSKMNDPRVYWGEKYITLMQDSKAEKPFKFGLPNEDGWAAYANHGHLFVKRFEFIDGVTYPDYSASSYETYTCSFMTEMESLSPLMLLEPGASVEHSETWMLFDKVRMPADEKEIAEKIAPLLK